MIKTVTELLKKYKEPILYGIFGVATAIISFTVFWLCDKLFGSDYYLLNNTAAWFCAVTFACFTNKFFVFRSESLQPRIFIREIAVFYLSRIMTLLMEEAGLWLLIEAIRMDRFSFGILSFEITGHLISKAMVGVVSVTVNYLFSKFVTFAKKDAKN